MKSKIIHEADGERTYALVLQTGDEVMSCLRLFAAQESLEAASFKAIGALSEAELAFFEWDSKKYRSISVSEQVEVASLTGDIAKDPEGQSAVHIHAVLGRRDGSAVAGHFQSGLVRPTLEIILIESPEHLRKRLNPELGIALIDPSI